MILSFATEFNVDHLLYTSLRAIGRNILEKYLAQNIDFTQKKQL